MHPRSFARRGLRCAALLLAALALACAAAVPAAQQGRRPNVLLIMTDDQGWGDLRVHGNDRLDTPFLDGLAAAGARFDRFYVSPVCAPTRASLLTGRYHLRTGTTWVTQGRETMRAEEVTLAEALRQEGRPGAYATGCFGKWHNGAHYPHHPNGQGFDEFFGFCGGHWNNYFNTGVERNGEPARARGYITDALTDAALEFVERNRARPFFCYVSYNAPHSPFQVPDRYYEKYRARGFNEKDASVYGMVENIDDNVGRLLAKLDALRLAEETIVVFLTDNGPNGERYNGGMKGTKGSVHEGGVRVPLLIRWPGRVRPGTVVPQIAAHIDLYPTLLDLCGVPAPPGPRVDGRSLAPLLRGETAGWPDRILFTHQSRRGDTQPTPGAARSQRYRLVNAGGGWELYDMIADPDQKQDVAAERPEEVARLRHAYEDWFADVTREGFPRLPIPVGHAPAPRVELPAPEASLEGGLAFRWRAGWANDWITGWQNPEARAAWDLDVVRPGRYRVTLLHTCPEAEVGARLRVEAGGRSVEGTVARAHDPEPLPSPDRVPRGEAFEKEWAALEAGVLELGRGRTRLEVRRLGPAGPVALELKGVRLLRLE